jgi:hypothetical protein
MQRDRVNSASLDDLDVPPSFDPDAHFASLRQLSGKKIDAIAAFGCKLDGGIAFDFFRYPSPCAPQRCSLARHVPTEKFSTAPAKSPRKR